MRQEPVCGCRRDGSYICEYHRRPEPDYIATGPASLLALALFIGTAAIWCAILG